VARCLIQKLNVADDARTQRSLRGKQICRRIDGNQPGDPVRAARCIVRAMLSDAPPHRLPVRGWVAADADFPDEV